MSGGGLLPSLALFVPYLTLFAVLAGPGGALAQNVGPDETVRPNGAVRQELALTPTQRRAIYDAVIRQRVRPSVPGVAAAIGAPVPQAAELGALPDPTAAGDPPAALLKYAMVEDDVVVVDPISMCVVDIIHSGAKP